MQKRAPRELRSSARITTFATFAVIFMMACGSDVQPALELGMDEAHLIASNILKGDISQDDLINLQLSEQSKKFITLEFAKLRGWNITAENFHFAVKALFEKPIEYNNAPNSPQSVSENGIGVTQQALGSCAQKVEQANGSTGTSYVASIQSPSPGECGSDSDDKILVFNIYWGGTDPNNARYWSGLWWVRSVLSGCYSSGLSTNGLCGNTAHTCVGSCALVLLPDNDLYSIFLWHL